MSDVQTVPAEPRDASLAGEVYDLLIGVAADLEAALWSGDNAEVCQIVQSARHRLRREAVRIYRESPVVTIPVPATPGNNDTSGMWAGRLQVDALPVVCVRLARCENYLEAEGRPCTGLLAFQPGDMQAACSQCQAWCGAQVAHAGATISAGLTPAPSSPDPGDDNDTLREQLAEFMEEYRSPYAARFIADALLPLVVAYGDQRAEEGRQEAEARVRALEAAEVHGRQEL